MPNQLPFNQPYKRTIIRLVVIAILAALQPWLWQQVVELTKRVQEQRSWQQQIANVTSRVEQSKQAYNAQKDFLNQLELVAPREGSLPQVIERLERLAIEQQLKLEIKDIAEIKPIDPDLADSAPVQPLRVTFIATGPAASLLSFMDAAEHIQEISHLAQWSLTALPLVTPVLSATPQPAAAPLFTLTGSTIFFLQQQTDHDLN